MARVTMILPCIQQVKQSTVDEQIRVLDVLFEHSDSLIWFTLRNEQFMSNEWATYREFIETIRSRLLRLCHETELEGICSLGVDHLANIIGAHPRLGAAKQNLSIHSLNEQANLAKENENTSEMEGRLKELNARYESVYGGLRFVVFVNGRSRQDIIEIMQARINSSNSWFKECEIALNEMCDIALDRSNKYGEIKGKI